MRRGRRGTIAYSARPDSGADFAHIDDLQLIDVSLLARTEKGSVEVPGLGIAFDRDGLTVRKRSGEQVTLIPWSVLRRLTAGAEHVEGYGKAPRADLEVESDRRSHHFLVNQVDPGALAGAMSVLSARYAGVDLVLADHRGRRQRPG